MWNSIEEAKNKLKQISDSQTCSATQEDYANFEQNKKFLFRIAEVENSSLTVLDLYKKNYLLVCYRFNNIIGYSGADENSAQALIYAKKNRNCLDLHLPYLYSEQLYSIDLRTNSP